MTTLTPEKEAEDRLRTQVIINPGRLGADIRTLLASLSTERQAREVAEKEVERLSAECALGDMRASYDDLMEQHRAALSKLRAAEAALSALPPPVPTEEGEAEHSDLVTVVENLGVPEWRVQIGDVLLCYGESRADAVKIGERIEVAIRNRLAAPTQAPQDVAGLVEEYLGEVTHWIGFSASAINCGEQWTPITEDRYQKVKQARDGLRKLFRASPISHEDRPLELAAADAVSSGVTEALVLVPREPTEAMIMAAARKLTPDDFGWATASTAQIIRVRYRAMIAAVEDGPVPNGASAAATNKEAPRP